MTRAIRGYHLADLYEEAIALVMSLAPPGLTERWGVCQFDGTPDFRLNLGRYRVIGVAPQKTRVDIFMEWRKVFQNRQFYEQEPDFLQFEDAFGALEIQDWNTPWHIATSEVLHGPYVEQFLRSGMALIVRELNRRHPAKGTK